MKMTDQIAEHENTDPKNAKPKMQKLKNADHESATINYMQTAEQNSMSPDLVPCDCNHARCCAIYT